MAGFPDYSTPKIPWSKKKQDGIFGLFDTENPAPVYEDDGISDYSTSEIPRDLHDVHK
jgi:hypothetical protein